jgi:hypothetical protein
LTAKKGNEEMMVKNKVCSAIAVGAMALSIGVPAAGAQTAAQQGYDETGVLGSVDDTGGGNNGPAEVQATQAASDEGSDSLPFTGMDIGILLVLGAAAGGTGLVVRRVVRKPAL